MMEIDDNDILAETPDPDFLDSELSRIDERLAWLRQGMSKGKVPAQIITKRAMELQRLLRGYLDTTGALQRRPFTQLQEWFELSELGVQLSKKMRVHRSVVRNRFRKFVDDATHLVAQEREMIEDAKADL